MDRPPFRPPAASRSVLLVDGDNIVLADGQTDPMLARLRLLEVVLAAGPVDLNLLVMSRSLVLSTHLWPMLARLPLTLRLDPGGADAADHLLLDFAMHEIYAGGVTRVVVASGNGIFERLAEHAQLQVCVPRDHTGVSQSLKPFLLQPHSSSGAAV